MRVLYVITAIYITLWQSSVNANIWKAKSAYWKLQKQYQIGETIPSIVLVKSFADAWGIPVDLLAAQITHESNWDVCAFSNANAQGLFQVLPSTAKQFLDKNSYFDPIDNAFAATAYLKEGLIINGNDYTKALAYYHGGPNKRIHGKKTKDYVSQVLARYSKFKMNGWLNIAPISVKRTECLHKLVAEKTGGNRD